MTIELWIGEEFQTPQERRALDQFLTDMNSSFGQSDELYLILANYYVDGHQIDLTILKQKAIIIIELKECSDPFSATENGAWLTIPDERVVGNDNQNPFEQVRGYQFKWINLLKKKQNQFLSPAKAQSMSFEHVSAFVAISPSLHPDAKNQLPYLRWFRLVGLNELSKAVEQEVSRGLNFPIRN